MKSGTRRQRKARSTTTQTILATMGLLMLWGCGNADTPSQESAGSEGTQTPMKGFAAFGSQCVSGFTTDPKAVKLELWSCPFGFSPVQLAEPIQPIYLSADCSRKVLTIRSQDKSINTTWELMPDGSFYFTQEGLNAKLKNDGSGNSNCIIPLNTDMWGQVDCPSNTSDQAKIRFEMVMWLNKKGANTGASSGPASGGAASCQVPSDKCYFHALTSVDQCN